MSSGATLAGAARPGGRLFVGLGLAVALALGLLLVSGCGSPATPSSGPRPTFTPPAQEVALYVPTPPPTPTPVPAPTDTAAPTSTPLPTPTPTATPTPPIVVRVIATQADLRLGPSEAYPLVATVGAGSAITVTGVNPAGDWWQVCCEAGQSGWIADAVVKAAGELWNVPEVVSFSPLPTPTPVPTSTRTPTPTATPAWAFRAMGNMQSFPQGQNYFRVVAGIWDGNTPLWGYKLIIRKDSTGQTWLSDGSQAGWQTEPVQWQQNICTPAAGVLSNVKWDSNSVSVPQGNDTWEVTAADGGGKPLSAPVRFVTSASNTQWYYVVFISNK